MQFTLIVQIKFHTSNQIKTALLITSSSTNPLPSLMTSNSTSPPAHMSPQYPQLNHRAKIIESVRNTHLPLPHSYLFLSESDVRRNSTRKVFFKRLPTDSADSAKEQTSVHFSKQILLISLYRTQEQNQKRVRDHDYSNTETSQICTGLCEQPRSYFHLSGENFKILNLEMNYNFAN